MKTINILNGDALEVLKTLPDETIDCCVTSPPYYGLRDYGVDGQIGLEETPQEYINKLVSVFRELRRVMKKTRTLWLNIGDSYSGSGKGGATNPENAGNFLQGTNRGLVGAKAVTKVKFDTKRKELLMIPARLAIALSDDGWYLRQDIIWHKPNPMPESVKDRCTKSHEYIYLLTKSPKYYFNAAAISEPVAESTIKRLSQDIEHQQGSYRKNGGSKEPMEAVAPRYGGKKYTEDPEQFYRTKSGNIYEYSPKRNKRDVWTISTKPFKGTHFATFPLELAEICVLAGCPQNGVVSDIFTGSGTVGVVAKELNLEFIGIEINQNYCKMAENRIDNAMPNNNQITLDSLVKAGECK